LLGKLRNRLMGTVLKENRVSYKCFLHIPAGLGEGKWVRMFLKYSQINLRVCCEFIV